MVRTVVIILITALVGLGVFLAFDHGTLQAISFTAAEQRALAKSESDKPANVAVDCVVQSVEPQPQGGAVVIAKDRDGRMFKATFDAELPAAVQPGASLKLVGHVHGQGSEAYLHASAAALE